MRTWNRRRSKPSPAFAAWRPTPEWEIRAGRTSPDLFLLADVRNRARKARNRRLAGGPQIVVEVGPAPPRPRRPKRKLPCSAAPC